MAGHYGMLRFQEEYVNAEIENKSANIQASVRKVPDCWL